LGEEPLMVFKFSVVLFLTIINMLLRGKCEGNAQIYAKTRWEMAEKLLETSLSNTLRVLANSLEMPKEY
jgi:hypothetical protein